MINFHCTIILVVVLDSVITHTSAWFLDREIHQLVTKEGTSNLEELHCRFPNRYLDAITVSSSGVSQVLSNLDSHKVCGPD